jgi:hypothetical protein
MKHAKENESMEQPSEQEVEDEKEIEEEDEDEEVCHFCYTSFFERLQVVPLGGIA